MQEKYQNQQRLNISTVTELWPLEEEGKSLLSSLMIPYGKVSYGQNTYILHLDKCFMLVQYSYSFWASMLGRLKSRVHGKTTNFPNCYLLALYIYIYIYQAWMSLDKWYYEVHHQLAELQYNTETVHLNIKNRH